MRELRNLLERTALLCDGETIEASHVEQAIATGPSPLRNEARSAHPPMGNPAPARASQQQAAPTDFKGLGRTALRERLAAHTGSRAELAAQLGMSERSLYRKIRALGP